MKYSFKRILLYWPIIIIVTTVVIFFYKTFFSANIPFPGDILISEYKPWNKYSFSGYAPGSYPNKAQYPDTIRQIYPWKTLVISELKKGNLPLWNPYNFSGAPLLANFQSAALHPDNLLYLVLPQPAAWTILVILQPLLAFLFMYIFMRSLHLNKIGALFGGFTYAFSYFSIVWLDYHRSRHTLVTTNPIYH
jgi:hypothetical protein